MTPPDGTLVWNRLHGAGVGFTEGVLLLRAGEAREDTVHWTGRGNDGALVAPARYVARARLFSGMPQGMWTPPVTFHLTR